MHYNGFCEQCHNTYDNIPRLKMIYLLMKHKHLIYAILHSYASFTKEVKQ